MNDPNKKLKLEMASLQEICDVIKMDWHDMEHLIETQAKSIKALEAVQKYL